MPAVFEVLPQDGFQYLEAVDREAWKDQKHDGTWRDDGTRVGDAWVPLDVYSREPLLPPPDLWHVYPFFALEPRSVDLLRTPIDQSCEELPLPFENRTLTLLNVVYVIDAVDRSGCEMYRTGNIRKWAFHHNRLDWSLFKTPERRYGPILTVEGLVADGTDFKGIVEGNGLKGVKFREIYRWD